MRYRKKSIPLIGAALLAGLLLFFSIPISVLLNTVLVKPLFTSFTASVAKDITLTLFLVCFVIWMVNNQHSKFLNRIAIYTFVVYIFQRTSQYWHFIPTASSHQITYWDLIAVAFVIPAPIRFLKRQKNKIDQISHGFIEDTTVTKYEDDHFQRKTVANEIARMIELTNNKKSFAIGILGEYGSGKTSFLNLINLGLKDSVLKISFNPWSASNPETIRQEFFDLLAAKVAEIDSKISSLIYSYGRKLAGFDDRSHFWFNWINFFRDPHTTQSNEEYQQINKMLNNIDRKVVVTIDDLDRLHSNEIVEVLKLIRNTADFSNVIYLVGYDKAYIQEAIKTLSEVGGSNYLDKIFQLEIPLPKREEDDLLTTLQMYLKEMLSENHYQLFENVMIPNDFRSRYEKAYKGILRQGRDVIRFINGFKIVYKLIGEEVDFECLMLLELIKFRFPAIYDLIYTQSDLFLYETPMRSTHEQYFSPRLVKSGDSKKASDEISVFKTHIEKFEVLSPEDVSLLDGLFKRLFKGSSYHRPENKNSISYPLYFEIYFRYRLSQKDISDKDFGAAMASRRMPEYMEYCASHNLHKELMVRLLQEDISKSKDHFEDVLLWVFSFARTFVEKEGMFRFDYNALVDKIYNYHNVITDTIYKKDQSAYSQFIDDLFNVALSPFIFENELIYHLKKKGAGFILSIDKLSAHQLSYFTCMAESKHGLSEEVLWLFWGARVHYKVPVDEKGSYTEHWRFEPALVKKMKEYLAVKDPTEFLKFSINWEIRDHSLVSIHKQVLEMFDNPLEYRELIDKNIVLKEGIKEEYLQLLDQCTAVNFTQYVQMEFKSILRKQG